MRGSDQSTQDSASAIGGVTFKVDDMECGHCVGTIRQALAAGMPEAVVGIDLGAHLVTVGGDAARAEAIIRDAGFEPRLQRH